MITLQRTRSPSELGLRHAHTSYNRTISKQSLQPKDAQVESKPLREFKPVVVPVQYYLFGPIMAGFMSIFPGFFVFVISNILGGIFGDLRGGPIVIFGVMAYLASFVICMGLLWVKAFQEPTRTTYRLFADRIEYTEGLWNRSERTLVFDKVIDVTLSESVLQQPHHAGTISLVTQQLVSAGEGKIGNRTIQLRNVSPAKEIYDLIRCRALKESQT